MSRFTETMYANALSSSKGFNTGEPHAPVRHSWAEVHQRARRIAGEHGYGVTVADTQGSQPAGAPVEIAPVSYTHLTLPTILRV